MADVRVRETIVVDVDAAGDAALRRTWLIENIGLAPADFSRGFFRVEFTNRNVVVVGAEDGRGLRLPWAISEAEGGKIAVACSYNAILPSSRHLVVHLMCRLPQFMPCLHEVNGRAGTEYFERLGPFDAGGLTVEEPRLIEYMITVTDPRRGMAFLHNPFQQWQLASSHSGAVVRSTSKRSMSVEFRLGPLDRSLDITTVSTVGSRAIWAGIVTGGFWTVIGVAIGRLF